MIKIIRRLLLYKISEEVINLIEETLKNWRVELTAGEKSFVEVKIQVYSREIHYRHYYS